MTLENDKILEEAKEEYSEVAKEVKHRLQRDIRKWADSNPNEAEIAYQKGNIMIVYDATIALCGD